MLIVGDLHAKKNELRKNLILKLFEWLNTVIEKDESLVLLGDVFDVPLIDGEIIAFIMEVLKKFSKVIIVKGNDNHDGNLLEPLAKLDNIQVAFDITELTIDGNKCLLLPNKKDMKEYESLTGEYDYIFGHFSDIENQFGDEGIALSKDLKGKLILGHIHQSSKNCLGVPYPTRFLEHKQKHQIATVRNSKLEYKEIPNIFTYYEIDFDDDEVKCDYPYFQLFINNAPNEREARKKFKEYPIYKVNVKSDLFVSDNDSEDEIENEFDKKIPLGSYLEKFAKERDIDKNVYTILREVLQ